MPCCTIGTPTRSAQSCGGAEGVGCSEHHGFSCLFVLVGEFGDGGGFAYAIDANDKHHVGLVGEGGVEVFGEFVFVLFQQGGNFGTKDGVEFGGTDVFVSFDTFLQLLDNLESGLYPHVGGDKSFLKVVEDVLVNSGFAKNAFREFRKETFFGLGETVVEGLFFVFFTE